MVETLQRSGLWHMVLAEEDLIKQAGLKKEDFEQDLGCLNYKGRKVIVSHTFDKHLVISIEGKEYPELKELMSGFSTVVGYSPFCKYILSVDGAPPLLTYE